MRTKLIATGLLGTAFNMKDVVSEEIQAYGQHIRDPYWAPLTLPKSWEHLPLFWDSRGGIERLRKKFIVVTLSNAPLGFTTRLLKNACIQFDAITPLEMFKLYKPMPNAYMTLCTVYGVKPSEIMMVSANKDFGDIEAARGLGMEATLIRQPDNQIKTFIDLAESLGC